MHNRAEQEMGAWWSPTEKAGPGVSRWDPEYNKESGNRQRWGKLGVRGLYVKKEINSFDCLLLKIFKNVLEVN